MILVMAKEQNLSILSYLANELNSPVITIAAPIIAFVAITKSFLGHYVGAYEVMRDIILKSGKTRGKNIEEKTIKTINPCLCRINMLVCCLCKSKYSWNY